ncbi:MAG TPA: hypothetical protein VLX61_12020 [Anaerolineales bacterium]|nr:hypothetical protein [Anaerolineales bacterium]
MLRLRYQRKLVGLITTFLFLASCGPSISLPATPRPAPTLRPSPTLPPISTLPLTHTPDLVLAEKTATLFEQDFESGTALGIYDDYGNWSISLDDAGHHVYCNNQSSQDWQSFKFGSDTWTDYAVEARVEFTEENPDHGVEIYARIDSAMDGYRGTVNRGQAGLSYYPPVTSLGSSSFVTLANTWYTLRLEVFGDNIQFSINDQPVANGVVNQGLRGSAGFAAGPDTKTCVDDLRIWALTEDGRIANTSPLAKYEGECQYCFLDDEGPSAPVPLSNTYGFTYRSGDPREKITLNENFRVNAGENVEFDNKIILIKPIQRKDIEVFGTLTIKDCLLIWLQTDDDQTELRIKSGGTLIIKDSYSFWGNSFGVNWNYEDGSTVFLDHFIGDPWTTISGSVNYTAINYSTVKLTFLQDTHDTKVQIANAHLVWFEIFPPEGTYTFTLPAKRQWADWNISSLWPMTTVEMKDSHIYEEDISLNPNTHVTVQDTPGGVGIGWMIHKAAPGYVDCELKNMGEPGTGNENGKLYQDMTWDLACINSSLTLKNTRLEKVWPHIWGYVHVKVYNSNMAETENAGTLGTLEIYDSAMDGVYADSGGRIYLENSSVAYTLDVRDQNSVVYGFGLSGQYQVLTSAGGAYIQLEKPGSPWH